MIGTVVLIKGIDTFNPERGTRLAIHAARCIENEILMHLLVTKRRRSEVSIYNPIGHDREGNEITPPECPPSGVHPGARHCTCDWRLTWSPPGVPAEGQGWCLGGTASARGKGRCTLASSERMLYYTKRAP